MRKTTLVTQPQYVTVDVFKAELAALETRLTDLIYAQGQEIIRVLGDAIAANTLRLDEHDKRFDNIDARLDEHDRRFDKIDARLSRIEAAIESLLVITASNTQRLDLHDKLMK